MEWKNDDPPVGVAIEYERDDGAVLTGKLAAAGQFGIGNIAAAGVHMKLQFVDESGSAVFEVRRWRELSH